jgi:molybdopterin-guanine dinucleotide biosynthesis protein A
MPRALTVVLLAGGRSRRFGRDKLTEPIEGVSTVERVARAAQPLAGLLVVAAPRDRLDALRGVVRTDHEPMADDPTRWPEGPAGAIAQAIHRYGDGPILVVPGDLPWIETGPLVRFRSQAEAYGATAAVPYWAGGETEHLLLWVAPDPGRVDRWERGGRPSPRASEFIRGAMRAHLVPVGALIDDARTLAHLTGPEDRDAPTPRGVVRHDAPHRIITGTPVRLHARALQRRHEGDLASARASFEEEARWYSAAGLPLLARHALADRASLEPSEGGRGEPLSR